jgi:hypothetical protein
MRAVVSEVYICSYIAKEISCGVWKRTANKNIDLQVENRVIRMATFVKERAPGDNQCLKLKWWTQFVRLLFAVHANQTGLVPDN